VKNSIPGISIAAETDGEVTVKAGAGENWHDLVMWSIERDYAGLENLSLIPPHGRRADPKYRGLRAEQKDVFGQLEAIEIGSGEAAVLKAGIALSGIATAFSNQWENRFFITSVSFKLAKLSSPNTHYRYRTNTAMSGPCSTK
jgi:UDP-N-acetylmuramate dehydrogenase